MEAAPQSHIKFGNGDELIAAARRDRGKRCVDLLVLNQSTVVRNQRLPTGAFVDKGQFYRHAANPTLLIDVLGDHLGCGFSGHAEDGSRSRQEGGDTDLDLSGLALPKDRAGQQGRGQAGRERGFQKVHRVLPRF
jgi:hypothetical protein